MKRPSYEREALLRLKSLCELEGATFGHIWEDPKDPLPTKESEVDEFVKERTRLYRRTWVLPIIDALLSETEESRDYLTLVARSNG